MIKVKDGMVSMSDNRIELMSKSESELSDELKRARSEATLRMLKNLKDLGDLS